MATSIDTTRLAGFFKDRFGEDASALPTEGYDVLAQKIKFDDSLMLGEKITEPVMVQDEMGWTFAGGNTTGTMFALNDANSGLTVEATWTSQEFVIRAKTSWKALRAAQTSAQAFGSAYDKIVKSMRNSSVYVREFSMLYGGSDLGTIESGTGTSTNRVYTLSKASSSAGLWWKMAGALMDVYDSYGGTKKNTNADVVVVSVDLNATTGKIEVTVTGNATDLTAIDNSAAYGFVFIPKGASSNMMIGIDAIARSATSYAGISQTSYPLWKSTSLNASSAALTFSKVMQGLKVNRLKSGPGKRTCLCSEATITDVIDNLAALQSYVNKSGGGDFDLGGGGVTFTAPGGQVEFLPHVLCKEGEAFLLDFDALSRVGSTDFTFDPTGRGTYFEHVSGYAGLELMGYWDQGVRCEQPSTITKITGIVNTF